jgi:peptidoglycan hydrolase CwlO-like protein
MHYKESSIMNKKIIIGIAVGVVIFSSMIGIKSIMGEKIEIPAEEHTENALNMQENNQSQIKSPTGENESVSSESTESGP